MKIYTNFISEMYVKENPKFALIKNLNTQFLCLVKWKVMIFVIIFNQKIQYYFIWKLILKIKHTDILR